MRHPFWATLLLMGCGASGGTTLEPGACPRPEPVIGVPAARAVTAEDPAVAGLAADLDALTGVVLPQLESTPNGAFSALSLVGMFSILLPGADPATSAALGEVLQLSQPESDHHEALSGLLAELDDTDRGWGFEWGAGFWHRPALTPTSEWTDLASEHYGVDAEPLDFQADGEAARQTLNVWVDAHTRCLIPEFYPPGYDFSRAVHVAIHAMAVEALWEEPFDAAFTTDRPFTRADGTTVTVPFMESRTFHGAAAEVDDDLVLRLPYKGGDLAMYIVLPDEVVDPAALLGELDHARISDWAAAPATTGALELRLPKWTTLSAHNLRPPLDALGYEPLVSAPMPDLCDGCLMPDVLRQVVVVQVDEKGTRAAAASSGTSNDSMPQWIEVDRPFLWFLRDDVSGVVMWTGWVGDPSAE